MKKAILLLLVAPMGRAAFAQSADAALTSWAAAHPSEKIYIHYDRSFYRPGDTVWFKAYVLEGGVPSASATNFRIELAGPQGNSIASQVYPVVGAVTSGALPLPDTLSFGNYTVRAATSRSGATPAGYRYRSNLVVATAAAAPSVAVPVTIRFYPEGGTLIDGVMSTLATQATDKWGRPVAVEGVIRNEAGSVATTFRTGANGYGHTLVRFMGVQKYTGEVTVGGKTLTFPGPVVQPSGINLHVAPEKSGYMFQLSRGTKDKERFADVTLVASVNNRVVYEMPVAFDNYPSIRGHLVTDSLPSGLLHFAVLSKDNEVLAERLAFINGGDYEEPVQLLTPTVATAKGARNDWELHLPAGFAKTFSVSVTDADAPVAADHETFPGRLLLGSDLEAHLYGAAHFLEARNDSARAALDEALMTQTWTRYHWPELMKGESAPAPAPGAAPAFLRFSGTVIDEKEKKPVGPGTLQLLWESPGSDAQQVSIPVSASGRFDQDSLLLYGKGRFYYTFMTSNNKTRAVQVQPDAAMALAPIGEAGPAPDRWALEPLAEAKAAKATHQADAAGPKELPNVTAADKTTKPGPSTSDQYTKGVFKSVGRVIYDVNATHNPNGSLGVLEFLRNAIQGVELEPTRFINRRASSMNGAVGTVEVFLDEASTTLATVQSLTLSKVALIRFYDIGFVGSSTSGPGGAIAIYLKKNEDPASRPGDPALPSLEFSGYNKAPGFTGSATTLYWNGNAVLQPAETSFPIRFVNTGGARRFRIVVEGMDARGKLLHLERIVP